MHSNFCQTSISWRFEIFINFPIKSGYWVKLSQIYLIKTQKIIAYLVANFMRISKMVFKILSNVTLLSLWRHKVDTFCHFLCFLSQNCLSYPFKPHLVCVYPTNHILTCVEFFEESDGDMLKTVKWCNFELWRHKYQENCVFFNVFHYKIIRLTRINHTWLVKITPNSQEF